MLVQASCSVATVSCAERSALVSDVVFDVLGFDAVERLGGEERSEVVAQVRGDGHAVALLATLELKAPAEILASLLHAHPLAARC